VEYTGVSPEKDSNPDEISQEGAAARMCEMGSTNTRKGACGKVRRGLDAHLSGELDAEAARATRAHLKECGACAALLEERLRVRELLRRAVRGVRAPPHLAGSIRALIRQG